MWTLFLKKVAHNFQTFFIGAYNLQQGCAICSVTAAWSCSDRIWPRTPTHVSGIISYYDGYREVKWDHFRPYWSSPASPRKTPSLPTLLLRLTFYFQHGFSKNWGQQASKLFWTLFQVTFDDKLQILTQHSFHNFVVQNIFAINYFVLRPLWKDLKKNIKKNR